MTPIHLRLYVTGRTVSAERARAALGDLTRRLARERGSAAVTSEVVDVLENPHLAANDAVFATPTVLRLSPGPCVKLFGDLSSVNKLLRGLGLSLSERPAAESPVADVGASSEDEGRWPCPLIISDTFSSPAAALE